LAEERRAILTYRERFFQMEEALGAVTGPEDVSVVEDAVQ
jgi:hypothetical protein